jgi:hypothetical protein
MRTGALGVPSPKIQIHLFEDLGDRHIELEPGETIAIAAAAQLRFRVVKGA